MPCSVIAQRYALQRVRGALTVLTKAGFGPLTEPYQAVLKMRNELMESLGLMKPTKTSLVKLFLGLSPGTISVWLNSDSGWFTEARERPGAPAVYHYVSDEVASSLLKGELTHELESELMKPDEYLGE